MQLNFKKLYAHAEYHYCKHNYHKLSLPSVALQSLCMILLTYSFADIYSVSMQRGEGGRGLVNFMSFWKLVGYFLIHWCCALTWMWGNQKEVWIFSLCFCTYWYMCSYTHRCTNWLMSHPNCSLFTLLLQAILIVAFENKCLCTITWEGRTSFNFSAITTTPVCCFIKLLFRSLTDLFARCYWEDHIMF